jgi:hypothetical protein
MSAAFWESTAVNRLCEAVLVAAAPVGGLPLAAWEDVLQGLVPIIFMILYGIAQLIGNRDQVKRPPPRRVPPPQPLPRADLEGAGPAAPGGGPPPRAATLEEALRREVDEFLRRAGGQPAPAAPAAPPAPKKRPAAPTAGPPRPQRQGAGPPLSERQPPPEQRPRAPLRQPPSQPREAARSEHESVAEHVARRVGTGGPVGQRTTPLGDYIDHSDERMEAHLRERFEHQVGSLGKGGAPASAPLAAGVAASPAVASADAGPSLNAAQLRQLLTRPEGMRQALILSEILRRPEI